MELKDLNLSASDRQYINLVEKNYRCLTPQEEKELLLKYNQGDFVARQKLIEGNLYIVVNVALNFAQCNMDFSELVQEGNEALIKAIDSYDFNKSKRLTSYIYLTVYRKLKNMFLEKNYGHSYEENNKLAFKLYTIYYKYINEYEEEPSNMFLADNLGIDIVKVKEIKNHLTKVESLEQITSNPKIYNEVSLACDYEEDFINDIYELKFENSIRKCFETLTSKQKLTIEYYLGLFDEGPYNFKEIAAILGIKHQGVCSRYNNAIEKITRRFKLKYPCTYNECCKNRVLTKK